MSDFYFCGFNRGCLNEFLWYLGIGTGLFLFLLWRSPPWFVYLLRLIWLPFQAFFWVIYLLARIHGSVLGWIIILLVALVSLRFMITPRYNNDGWIGFFSIVTVYYLHRGCQLYADNFRKWATWQPAFKQVSSPKVQKIPIVSLATSSKGDYLDEQAMISNLPGNFQDLIKGKDKEASGGDIYDEMMEE